MGQTVHHNALQEHFQLVLHAKHVIVDVHYVVTQQIQNVQNVHLEYI